MGIDNANHEGYFEPTTYETLTSICCEEGAADKKAAYLLLVYNSHTKILRWCL